MPSEPLESIKLNGFAAVGNGGTIQLGISEQRDVVIKAVMPDLVRSLGINGEIDLSGITIATVRVGGATVRKLRRQEMLAYITQLAPTHQVRRMFEDGSLVLVVADIVVYGLEADISLTAGSNKELEDRLAEKVNGTISSEGNALSFRLSKSVSGSYRLSATKPLIVAVLPKKQRTAGSLSSPSSLSIRDEWVDWIPGRIAFRAKGGSQVNRE